MQPGTQLPQSKLHELDRAILQRDPAGGYAMCDDDTRAAMLAALAEIAAWSGRAGAEVAASAVALSERSADRVSKHVGYFLIGEGRPVLESELGCRVPLLRRCRRAASRFATTTYLTLVALLTAATLVWCALSLSRWGITTLEVTILTAAVAIPALTFAVGVTNWLAWVFLYPPRRLPRIRFGSGIPDEYRTLVVVPALLHSLADVESILAMTEMNHLENRDQNILFAVLTDFPDAPQPNMPDDAPLLAAMEEGLLHLNERHGTATRTPFYLLHRNRERDEREGVWMGWERKRGKLMELNQILLGGSPRTLRLCVGDASVLATIRYVISLDADTRLPLSAATRLIGTLAHPLNAPISNEDGSLARGFSIIQPRIRKLHPSQSATTFALRMNQFTTVLDYLQDIHQLLFGNSLYCGKGIYDVKAFEKSLRGRLPLNAVLSHDHLEGMHGRVGVALDVAVAEDALTNVVAQMRQAHRWTRGDWQSLPWMLPIVPTEAGPWAWSRLAAIDRWRIFENLRSSLVPVTTFGSLVLGWLVVPEHSVAWTLAMLGLYGHQAILMPLATIGRAVLGRTSWTGAVVEALHSFRQQTQRLVLLLIFIVYQSTITTHAIGTTLHRLLLSRRKLLEWTASAQANRTIGMTPRYMWRELSASVWLAAVVAAVLAIGSPRSLPAAAVLLVLWLLAPQIAYWTGRRAGTEAARGSGLQTDLVRAPIVRGTDESVVVRGD